MRNLVAALAGIAAGGAAVVLVVRALELDHALPAPAELAAPAERDGQPPATDNPNAPARELFEARIAALERAAAPRAGLRSDRRVRACDQPFAETYGRTKPDEALSWVKSLVR